MKALMQDAPLLLSSIIDHAAKWHGEREIVSLMGKGVLHRETYKEAQLRAKKLAQALKRMGVKKGEVVATMAWNHYRHFESWYGVSGMGAVVHTLNPRLFPDQLIYIMNHAGASLLLLDVCFLPLIEKLAPHLPKIRGYVFFCGGAEMPEHGLQNAYSYEEILEAESGDYEWEKLDENHACGICYTSGTTDEPKGVVYSHRSNVLHCLATLNNDVMGISACDVVMPVVPMFHANAWGIVFSAPAQGAKLVNPNAMLDPESLLFLLEKEEVSFTAAVPTIWAGLLQYLQKSGKKPSHLKRVVIGGAAVPSVMIEAFAGLGIEVRHAWGMTETSPLGVISAPKAGASKEQLCKQGRPPFLIDIMLEDEGGDVLPHNGEASGKLLVRGPFVSRQYIGGENILTEKGWFDSGDIASIDGLGFMEITDRQKDMVKSGGEWISSVQLENIAASHEGVLQAAVIAKPHEKWGERPLLLVVATEEAPSKEEILAFLKPKVAKFWLPDEVLFIEEMPINATGKIDKKRLRKKYAS